MPEIPFGPFVKLSQLLSVMRTISPKPESDEREVIAFQSQGRNREEKSAEDGYENRERHCAPETHSELCIQEGKTVCADCVICHESKVQQTREADDNIQTQRQDDIDTRENRHIDNISLGEDGDGSDRKQYQKKETAVRGQVLSELFSRIMDCSKEW